MTTFLIAVGAFFGYIIAYHTYGRFLAKKIFRLRPDAVMPSVECRDDVLRAELDDQVRLTVPIELVTFTRLGFERGSHIFNAHLDWGQTALDTSSPSNCPGPM